MKGKWLTGVLVLAMAAVTLAGCGAKDETKEKVEQVTLNEVAHSIFYAPQYVAIEEGYFADEGIDLTLITGFGADKVLTAMISGDADIGFMGAEATVYAYLEGTADPVVNFAQLTQRAGNFVVGREKDNSFTWEKLKNKEVLGGRKGGMPEMVFEYVLAQKGIDKKDVNINQSIDFGSTAAAFSGGQGDYTIEFEPSATLLEQKGDGYVVASETCACDVLGAEFVRDVEPGEIVTIDRQGIRSRDYSMYKRCAMCSMEYIYFARPDSDIDGCNVHAYRKESGRLLFKESPADADIVVGVPDSSLSAAMGYAEASGLPYEMGLIKNKYIGRTFIQPSQELREKGVRMKLSAVRSIVKGKRVVLVDDSIVRGTTSRRSVTMLKEAGATEVHVRIASPQMTHPCFYGVDTSTRDELISARKDLEGVREEICADSLAFLTPGALLKAGNRKELCMACFTCEYPTALYQSVDEANKDVKC